MECRTPRDVGRHARACRHFHRLRQSEVAAAAGVSRQWINALERGKPTLELGLVLRAFEELGLDLTVKRADPPPSWTVPLTIAADIRESRSVNAPSPPAHGSAVTGLANPGREPGDWS